MLRRGGARSGRDLNCQSAAASWTSASAAATDTDAFIVQVIGDTALVRNRRIHCLQRGYIDLAEVCKL